MKYITYIRHEHDYEHIILFGDNEKHSDMAKQLEVHKVLGAGFIGLDPLPYCRGDSISLHVSSREQDTHLLRACLNL